MPAGCSATPGTLSSTVKRFNIALSALTSQIASIVWRCFVTTWTVCHVCLTKRERFTYFLHPDPDNLFVLQQKWRFFLVLLPVPEAVWLKERWQWMACPAWSCICLKISVRPTYVHREKHSESSVKVRLRAPLCLFLAILRCPRSLFFSLTTLLHLRSLPFCFRIKSDLTRARSPALIVRFGAVYR